MKSTLKSLTGVSSNSSGTTTLFERNFHVYIVNNKVFLVWQIVLTIAWIFIAGYAYDAFLSSQGTNEISIINQEVSISFIAFLTSSAIIFSIIEATKLAGDIIQQDRHAGMFMQMLLMPFSRMQYVSAVILLSLVMSFVGTAILFGVITPIILPQEIANMTPLSFGVFIYGIFAGSVILASIAIIFSLLIKSTHIYGVVIGSTYMVLFPILSSMYYPIVEQTPEIMKIAFYLNPLTHFTDVVRAGMFGGEYVLSTATIQIQTIALGAIAAVAFCSAVYLMESDRKNYR